MLRYLNQTDIADILRVEHHAFIPQLQTTTQMIIDRMENRHIYCGIGDEDELFGTFAVKFAHFTPDFDEFKRRYPTFSEYASLKNQGNPNAVFVYSLGIVPKHRNGINAKKLLATLPDVAEVQDMSYIVGNIRIPSYNGSNDHRQFERVQKNRALHEAIDEYHRSGILPPNELVMEDPVVGFYLTAIPNGKILGITDASFIPIDKPSGGQSVIGYTEVGSGN